MPALNPETGIRNLLLADNDLSATLGTRIYPLTAPEGAGFPLGVYERDNTDVQHDMGGAGNLKYCRSTWTWYGYDYDALNVLAEDVEAILDGNRSTVTVGANNITFQTLFLEDQTGQPLKPNDGTGRAVFQIMQTYFVAYDNS